MKNNLVLFLNKRWFFLVRLGDFICSGNIESLFSVIFFVDSNYKKAYNKNNMKKNKCIGAIPIIFLIALLVTTCIRPGNNDDSESPDSNSVDLSSYFPTSPGFHLEYDFLTDGNYNSGKRWISFQDAYSDGSVRYLYTGELNVAFVSFGNTRWYSDADYIITNRTTTGSNDHIAYWQYVYIPRTTRHGATYTKNNIDFTVTTDTSYGSYPDCVRMDYDSTSTNSDPDFRGAGHFYLAKNVGIVYLTFTHTATGRFGDEGDSFSYTLSSNETLSKKTFSGSITSSDYPILVSICTNTIVRDHYFHTETDASGDFSIDFYYKGSTPLTRYAFGYDINPTDDIFDNSPAYAYYSISSLTDGNHDIETVIYNN